MELRAIQTIRAPICAPAYAGECRVMLPRIARALLREIHYKVTTPRAAAPVVSVEIDGLRLVESVPYDLARHLAKVEGRKVKRGWRALWLGRLPMEWRYHADAIFRVEAACVIDVRLVVELRP